ncbi:MAG TPA: ATP-binding protein [Ramlibacter sp.]|nr:ATP-binding protein [Ramlibacter sp.]
MTRTPLAKPWPARIAASSAVLLVLLGATVLAGWIVNAPTLIQIRPYLPPMTRNVAASFLLLGVALLVLAARGPRWIAALCAAPVLLVSCISYADFAFGLDSGIHEILGRSYINEQLRSPGRMAPITSVSLAVTSATLLGISTILPVRTGLGLAVNGSVVAAFGIVATLYVKPSLAALHTGLGIAVAGVGLVALAWRASLPGDATPRWLPVGIAAGMAGMTAALLRALLVGGYAPSGPLPSLVLGIGAVLGPMLAYTVYLAQRAHAQSTALERSQAWLEEAQALSGTGSFWWRVATGEITCSRQLHRILDLDEDLPPAVEQLSLCFDSDKLRALTDAAGHASATGLHFDFEHRLQRPGRPDKHLHVLAHGALQKDGGLEYIGAVQDVTAHRQSEEALATVRSEFARVARITSLSGLTASIAHEVQQPLAAIILNASTCLRMLEAEPPNVAGARETARRSVRDANRAAQVISRLRALFARKPFTTEPLDLNAATREVIALCSGELQRAGIQLETGFERQPLVVSGDRVELQQVVLNLILNASEAMSTTEGRRKVLVIRTEADDPVARLSVKDVGTGFARDLSERLFDAFYTTKPDGMGIGLSVSRAIIERHAGRLWADANEPGATFSFTLPLLAGQPADALSSPDSGESRRPACSSR